MAMSPAEYLTVIKQVWQNICTQVLRQYRSVADYVQIEKLDFDTVEDEGDIRTAVLDGHYRRYMFALAAR
jgi:hypothetical protein